MAHFRAVVVAMALFAGFSPLSAQQAPPAQAPAPQAQIAESHLAVAREVVVGSGLSRSFEGMAQQIADQIRVGYSRTRPEIIKDMEEVLKPIVSEMGRNTDSMIKVAATLYAMRMSEPELKDIAAFFKSPAGQKYVGSQGEVMNALFGEMQVFSQALGNMMIDRLKEELRKKNIQL